jgi:hypothetical protein
MKEYLTIKSNKIADSLKWNNKNTESILVDDIAKSSLDSYKLTILLCL